MKQRCPYPKERQREDQGEPGHDRCQQVHKDREPDTEILNEEIRKIVTQELIPSAFTTTSSFLALRLRNIMKHPET